MRFFADATSLPAVSACVRRQWLPGASERQDTHRIHSDCKPEANAQKIQTSLLGFNMQPVVLRWTQKRPLLVSLL